jgi:hypothetical protein
VATEDSVAAAARDVAACVADHVRQESGLVYSPL